jgi:hypothetical protein
MRSPFVRLLAFLAATLWVLVSPCWSAAIAQSDDVIAADVRNHLLRNRPDLAYRRIRSAPNRLRFLSTALGQAYYAASICNQASAPPLTAALLASAASYARSAHESLDEQQRGLRAYAQSVHEFCNRRVEQIRNGRRTQRMEVRCASDSAIPLTSMIEIAPAPYHTAPIVGDSALRRQRWYPYIPREDLLPGEGIATEQAHVPAGLLARWKDSLRLRNPITVTCAPFLVVAPSSALGDTLCARSRQLTRALRSLIRVHAPHAWITVAVFGSQRELRNVTREFGAREECQGEAAFFDPFTQTVGLARNQTGALEHELVHALIFWSAPGTPRWLDEGLAAVMEGGLLPAHVGLPLGIPPINSRQARQFLALGFPGLQDSVVALLWEQTTRQQPDRYGFRNLEFLLNSQELDLSKAGQAMTRRLADEQYLAGITELIQLVEPDQFDRTVQATSVAARLVWKALSCGNFKEYFDRVREPLPPSGFGAAASGWPYRAIIDRSRIRGLC